MSETQHNLLWVVFFTVVFPMVLVILCWLSFKFIKVNKPAIAECPNCHCQGKIASFGRFKCSACSRSFFAKTDGRVTVSLINTIPKFVLILSAFVMVMFLIDIYFHHWWGAVSMACYSLAIIVMSSHQKKFPEA